jgi:tripartite-type tricarboxylate transporter receptor subunit TctC
MKRFLMFAALALSATTALADAFPSRPIKFVVAYPAGGGVDFMARLVAGELSNHVGQSVIVENKPGAGGGLATGIVAKATPDGYTILVTGDAPVTQLPLLTKTTYDPYTELAALVKGVTVPTAVTVPANSPYKSFKELLEGARANPGKVSWGTPGNGSAMHAELELLKERMGVDIVHVPYKGAPPIIADTIGGQISVGGPGLPPTIANIKSGHLRLLAIWEKERNATFPDVPTVMEATGEASLSGLPTWYGFLLPAGVPKDIAQRLETGIIASLKSAEVSRKLSDAGATVVAQPSEPFDKANRAQSDTFAAIFKKLGLKAD